MFPFFETISILQNEYRNLSEHQERVNKSFEKLFPHFEPLNLSKILPRDINPLTQHKLKIYYNQNYYMYSLRKYYRKYFKSFIFKDIGQYNYEYKWTDRSMIDQFVDISILGQETLFLNEGYLTDSSMANIILSDGTSWWTPEYPLLKGTMRASLIKENKIQCTAIHLKDLRSFESFKLINAMNSFDEAFSYPVSVLNEIKILHGQ